MKQWSHWKRSVLGWLLLVLVACTQIEAENAATPIANARPVAQASTSENRVTKVDRFGTEAEMPAPATADLFVGEGIAVDELGKARLTFLQDLLTVEVLRQGELHVKETSLTGNETLLALYQGAGVVFNDFDSSRAIGARLEIDTDFSRVVVRGTQLLVIREAHTLLEWIVVLEGHENAVRVTANGNEVVLTTNQAVWVAPIGPPGPVISVDGGTVRGWLEAVRRGEPVAEMGEVVWARATGEVAADLPNPLPIDTPFMYGNVEIRLDRRGRYERMDCNGDGRGDIWLENGRLALDLRQIRNRVRDVQVVVRNDGGVGTAVFTGFNPEGYVRPIAQMVAGQGSGAIETLGLASQQEPFHFADLMMERGCFLGLDLTPTQNGGGVVPTVTAVSPSPTPPPAQPIPPTRPAPLCRLAPPSGWVLYTVQPGNTLFSLSGRTAAGVAQVKQVNCLVGDSIQAGQVLWLPPMPVTVIPSATPSATPPATPSATPSATPPVPVVPATLLAPPPEARFVCGPHQDSQEVALTWQPNNEAGRIAGYELEISRLGAEGAEVTDPLLETRRAGHALVISCSVQRVRWRVRVVAPAYAGAPGQRSEWSEQRPFILTRDTSPPRPPVPLSPDDATVACERGAAEVVVALVWQAAVDETAVSSYTVGVRELGKRVGDTQTTAGDQTSLLWRLPCTDASYQWGVVATDSFGQTSDVAGYLSFAVETVDQTPPPPPRSVSPGGATLEEASFVVCVPQLLWEPSADASGIEVYVVVVDVLRTADEGWLLAYEEKTGETSLVPNMDYSPDYVYRWQVAAMDRTGNIGEASAWRYYRCDGRG